MANMDPTRPIEKENAMSLSKSEQSDMSNNLCHHLVNTVPRMSLPVDYKLNQKIALQKKLTACDRTPFTVKHNKISTTTTMNTVVFEYFRTYIEHYLTHIKKYKVEILEAPDKCGAITKDIVRVFENSTHLYTINLHTTTSRVMINGPRYARFTEEDMPVIMEKIIEMTENIGNTSSITKHHIESRLAELDHQLPRRKQLSSKKHEEGMERKEYPSRRITQITDDTNQDTFDIPIEVVEEVKAPLNNTTAAEDAIEDISANDNINNHIPIEEVGVPVKNTTGDGDSIEDISANTAHEKANNDHHVATNTEIGDTNGNTNIINEKDNVHHTTTANESIESTTTVIYNEQEENMLDEFIFKTLATLVAREFVHNVLTYTIGQQKKQIDDDTLEKGLPLPHQAQTHTTNQATTEKVRRSSRQTKATEKVKQSKEKDKKKVIRAKRKQQDESESEKIDERCPKCMEMVEEGSDGIVCETCLAYWHYSCADVNEEMVSRMRSNNEDFLCVKHKPSSSCSPTNLDTSNSQKSTNDVRAPPDENVETTLRNKITMLEKEIKKIKLTNREDTSYKAELKKKTAEIQKLKTEIEETNANHNKILDQKQITLDSLGNTIATLKKERTKIQTELKTYEKKNSELEDKIQHRLAEIKQLKADNLAHVEFAKTNLILNDSVNQLEELQNENKQLNEKIIQFEKQMTESRKNSEKVADKNKEIKQVKTQISSLEERIGELQNENQQCVRELNVSKADLQREKELNTLLTRKNNEEVAKNGAKNANEVKVEAPNPKRQAKRNNRGLCWHEVLESESCPFANCMFSHEVSADDRQNEQIRTQALRNKANAPPRRENHNVQPSKRYLCHFFVLDMCRRGDRCRFSHDASKFPADNHTQKAKQYIESRKVTNTNHPNWQQNTSITERHHSHDLAQQANLAQLYQYDNQQAQCNHPASPITLAADEVSNQRSPQINVTPQMNVIPTQSQLQPQPQLHPQAQLQPTHDDSFLLLVLDR